MGIIYSRTVYVNFTRAGNNEPDDILDDPADQTEPILDFDELVRIAERAYRATGLEIGVRTNGRETLVHHRSPTELKTAGSFEIVAFGEDPTFYAENINRLDAFIEEELPACNVRFEEFWDSHHVPVDEGKWLDELGDRERPKWAAPNLKKDINPLR